MEIHLEPKLLIGRLVQVTDVGVVLELKGRMGMLHLPRRSVIADSALAVGDEAQVWLSYAQIIKQQGE